MQAKRHDRAHCSGWDMPVPPLPSMRSRTFHSPAWPWRGREFVLASEAGEALHEEFPPAGDPVKSLESTVLDGYVRNAPSTVFVLLAQATFVVAALFNLVPVLLLFGWYSLVVLHGYVRYRMRLRYPADPTKDLQIWIPRLVMLSAANGSLWGGFGLVMATRVAVEYQLVILIVLMCLAAEKATTELVLLPRIFIVFLAPTLLPVATYMFFGTHPQRVAALAVVASTLLFRFRRQLHRALQRQFHLEAEQRRLCCKLESERRAETDLLRTKTLFLESMAHDLRQPVYGMELLVQELLRSPGAAVFETQADELQRGLETLNRYLSTIHDHARVNSGPYKPDVVDLPIRSILDRVLSENLRLANSHGLDLRCRSSSMWVSTDPTLVYSIVSNLVSNAIKHAKPGRILIGTRRSGSTVWVEVWDSGVGISDIALQKVRGAVYQVRTSRPVSGRGKGLVLVLRMAHLIGSTVTVRTEPGKGSRFSVSLPMAPPHLLMTDLMGSLESPDYDPVKNRI
jgi:signal transduction histidine kinase